MVDKYFSVISYHSEGQLRISILQKEPFSCDFNIVWIKPYHSARVRLPNESITQAEFPMHICTILVCRPVALDPLNKQHLTALCLLVRTVHHLYGIVLVRQGRLFYKYFQFLSIFLFIT